MELYRSHEEAVGHEAGEAFKVEGWWGRAREWKDGFRFFTQVVHFEHCVGEDRTGACVGGGKGFSSSANCGEGLGNGVSNATEDGVGYHSGKDRFGGIVRVEFRNEAKGNGHFDEEDDGVQEWL